MSDTSSIAPPTVPVGLLEAIEACGRFTTLRPFYPTAMTQDRPPSAGTPRKD